MTRSESILRWQRQASNLRLYTLCKTFSGNPFQVAHISSFFRSAKSNGPYCQMAFSLLAQCKKKKKKKMLGPSLELGNDVWTFATWAMKKCESKPENHQLQFFLRRRLSPYFSGLPFLQILFCNRATTQSFSSFLREKKIFPVMFASNGTLLVLKCVMCLRAREKKMSEINMQKQVDTVSERLPETSHFCERSELHLFPKKPLVNHLCPL